MCTVTCTGMTVASQYGIDAKLTAFQAQMDQARKEVLAVEGNMSADAAQLAACQREVLELEHEAKAAQQHADLVLTLAKIAFSSCTCCMLSNMLPVTHHTGTCVSIDAARLAECTLPKELCCVHINLKVICMQLTVHAFTHLHQHSRQLAAGSSPSSMHGSWRISDHDRSYVLVSRQPLLHAAHSSEVDTSTCRSVCSKLRRLPCVSS